MARHGEHEPTSTDNNETLTGKKSNKGKKIGAAVAITVTLAGAAAAAKALLFDGGTPTPPQGQTNSAPANPGGENSNPPKPETTQAPESLEIPAGLEAKETGKFIINSFDEWQNAGTNNKDIYNQYIATSSVEEGLQVLEDLTEKTGDDKANALFVENWKENETLVKFRGFIVSININTLETNLKTQRPDMKPEDKVAYQRNIEFEDAREIPGTDGVRVIEIDFIEYNNADQNRAGEEINPEAGSFGTKEGTFVVTLITVDGVEKISDIQTQARAS